MMLYFPRSLSGAAAFLVLCLLLPAQEPAEQEVGQLYASDASVRGSVLFVSGGTKVLSGASVVAGNETALLDLRRGGNVRFCPRTSVSVASTPSGSNLMLGMNTGQIEVNYRLADTTSMDALVTPDFRLLLQGPGNFHFALGADKRGNTCVRALKGNTGAVTVTELMGDTSYQVRPQEEVLFLAGRLAQRQQAQPTDCGCPEPSPLLRAEQAPPPAPTKQSTPAASQQASQQSASVPEASGPAITTTAAPVGADQVKMASNQPAPPPEMHFQVDAPFVYNAAEVEPPLELVTRLRLTPAPRYRINIPPPPEESVPAVEGAPAQPTATASEKPRKRSFFGRVGSFFAGVFR